MSQKYHASADPGNHPPRLITNDLYLAAFLLCQGCELTAVMHNERRRLSFVFAGERVRELREEYESGIVRLNVRSYRDTLLIVRRRMDARLRLDTTAGKPEQRSVPHVSTQLNTSVSTRLNTSESNPGRGVRAAQA